MATGIAMVVWTILLLPVTYLLYHFIKFYLDFKRRAKHILKFPGIEPHPIFGHLKEFPGPNDEGLKYVMELAGKSPEGLMKIFMGPVIPAIAVYHPNTVKILLKTSGGRYKLDHQLTIDETPGTARKDLQLHPFDLFESGSISVTSEPKPWYFGGYHMAAPWLGDGLLLSKGKKWARNRKLLSPAFHFDILKPYMEVNNKSAELFLDKLSKFSKRDEYFELSGHVSLLTLDVMLRCAFSYENDCQIRGESHPYVKAVTEMATTMVYRMLRPWLYPDLMFALSPSGWRFKKNCNFVHSVSREIIETRQKTLTNEGESAMRKGRYLDFLDILLTAKDSAGKGLSEQEIRDKVDTFLIEGHDTTSSGISWSLYSLASNPEHMKKCQQEIDDVLNEKGSDTIEWEDLPKLKHLTRCIKEALRLHSPVPFIERQTTKDMDIDGYFLPAGTIVDIHLYVLHHNPYIWDQPMEFRPERFNAENLEGKDNYAFVPFSAGPRNCIGQHFAMHEMKTIVARILRRFDLVLDPNQKVGHEVVVVMKAENGIRMKAVPRSP